MSKVTLKTAPTTVEPAAFIDAVPSPTRRNDAKTLLDLFGRVTGLEPVMWGPSIVGYGRYRYTYESGREGEFLMTGFSPRKANLVIYIMPGYRDLSAVLARLGKHRTGKACLYINKLADIDLDVLAVMIEDGVAHLKSRYQTFDC
ncbi:MAG: DUF1801 domain-containing protein [Alphaproteobacteria bacterium]|nr:DUF1801 domain-containing protein [Alphaproteobacteria bacterium]